ncbi:hypothetical protein PNEG_01304 [Pneumocystis murina B123]|uniref:Uncharacterized protein n=1 Tax=Pneumocystis murina (strain B123) TaxID=1069680 RepID=M7P9Q2_PNEMU|nr:hypothetical protein PNEG_01304 [Pneumocystis murina B123]EMR10600.1 hypothetical protein PNEG_01304 [Pneumocystis murina B123]
MGTHNSEPFTGISSDAPLDHSDQVECFSDLNFTEDSMRSPGFSNRLSQSSLTLHRSASWHRLSPSHSETSQIFSDNRDNSSRACLIHDVNTGGMYNFDIKDVIPPIPIISSNVRPLPASEACNHHADKRHGDPVISHVSSGDIPVSSVSTTNSKKCKYSSILYTDGQPQEAYEHLSSDDDSASVTSRPSSHIDSADSKSEKVEEDVCFPMTEECRVVKGVVDFEELNKFVTSQCLKDSDVSFTKSRKYSTGSVVKGAFASKNYLSLNLDKCENDVFDENYNDIPYKNSLSSSAAALDPQQKVEFCNKTEGIDISDRFSFFSSNTEKTIHVREIGDILLEGKTFQDIFGPDRGTWWLDCLNPTDVEMKMLQKVFSIHPLTAEDIRVQETREKVELFRSYYFVCFRSFEQDAQSEDYLEPVNIYIVVFREGLLTFHFSPIVHPANVRRRIRQLRDYVDISSDWICYALIDDITDGFGPCIHSIEKETDAIEDAVLITRNHESREMLRAIGCCRRKVLSLFRLLYGKADVIKMFAKRCTENYNVAPKSEIGLYLGDIQDHLITMTQNLIQFEKILSRSHSNYLAQLSISYVQSNERSSAMFSKITVIGTIFLPANIITGLFGMNVAIPGEHKSGWFWGIFWCIIGYIVLVLLIARHFKLI